MSKFVFKVRASLDDDCDRPQFTEHLRVIDAPKSGMVGLPPGKLRHRKPRPRPWRSEA